MDTEIKVNESIEVKKTRGRPKKERDLNEILRKRKEYYRTHADEQKRYKREKYLKMKQEEYKAKHNGSLDGFKIIQYNFSEK